MRSISAKVTADVSVLKREMSSGGDFVKRFGRQVKDTAREANADLRSIDATAAKLRDQMTSTSKAVDDLGRAFAKTGDATLLKQRDQQQKLLGDLKKAQALVFDVKRSEDDGGRSGKAYARALKDAVSSAGDIFAGAAMDLGKLIPPEVKVALVAGALAAAPIVGAALAGAVSGAAGGLGIAGGIALSLRDPKVKAAAGAAGEDIIDQLTRNADAVGPAFVKSLQSLRAEFASLDGEFSRIFDNSAANLPTVTSGVGDAITDVVQGLDEVIASSGPVMEALAAGIRGIGTEVKGFLSTVAANGETGAKALNDLFAIAKLAIGQASLLVEVFSKVYEITDKIGGFSLFGMFSDFTAGANAGKDSAADLDKGLGELGHTAERVEHQFKSLADTVNESIDKNLAAANAALRLQEANRSAAEAADKNRKVSAAEQRELLSLAEAANANTDALDELGRTSDQAAADYARQRKALIAAATAMGYSSGKAAELADQLLHIPKNTRPKVKLSVEGQAQLNAIGQAIAQLPGRKDVLVAIRVTGSTSVGGVRSALDKQSRNAYQRHGGVMTAMAAGGVTEAGIYPASNPPLVRYAEPETGGELYLPRRGSRARGRALVMEAASWYDMVTVPMAAGGVQIPGGVAMAGGGYVNVAPGSGGSGSSLTRSGSKLDTASAILSARDAVAALNKALKENGKSFSLSTAKGRENRSALISGIKAAQDAARAKFEETGSVKAANAVYDQYIAKLKSTVKGQKASTDLLKGLSKRPVYDTPTAAPRNSSGNIAYVQSKSALVEATEAASSFFDKSWGKPTFITGTAGGRDNLNALFEFLAAAEASAQAQYKQTGSAKMATSTYNASLKTLRGILAATGMSKKEIDNLLNSFGKITLGNRYGGVYQHAQGGALRDAHIASAGPTRYAYAEPATGGELFAPKNGNLAKTRSEVGWAVQNWWGGRVAWQGGPGTSAAGGVRTVAVTAPLTIQLGSETIERTVAIEVDTQLGAVASSMVYGTQG